jgi:hypothetical protein
MSERDDIASLGARDAAQVAVLRGESRDTLLTELKFAACTIAKLRRCFNQLDKGKEIAKAVEKRLRLAIMKGKAGL